MSALLTMEEGAICQGKLEYLRIFYELGVRMFTFTWNFPNELAYPNRYEYLGPGQDSFVPETEKGLTEKGFEFLEEMERLGIIADVSHLGDKGILDVISHAKRPFVASHSGARAVCRHCRNLTDEMIRGIGEKGGVMGVNYFTEFLRDKEKFGDPMKTSLDDMVAHIRRIIRVGGIDSVGLGSDFDGAAVSMEITNAGDMQLLAAGWRRKAFPQRRSRRSSIKMFSVSTGRS